MNYSEFQNWAIQNRGCSIAKCAYIENILDFFRSDKTKEY